MTRRCGQHRPRLLAAALLAISMSLGAPSLAQADTGRKIYDGAVLRPLGFVRVVVGVVAFPVFYLGSLVTGGSDTVTKVCITDPVDQTFRSPLGEF